VPPPSLDARRAQSVWVGIDPGQKGAIAALDQHGRFLWVRDMPIMGEGRRTETDVPGLIAIAREVGGCNRVRVFMEWNQTRPDEAPEASKRMGVAYGHLEMAFAMAGCRPERVAANKWKGRLGLQGKSLDAVGARKHAVQTAETFIQGLPLGSLWGPRGGALDGRAEALLIAWEALTSTLEGLRNQPEDVRLTRIMFGGSRRRRKNR